MAEEESEDAAAMAAPAESEVQSHREKTQMRLSRKELTKRKQKYTEFWASLAFSTISFCMTVGLLLAAYNFHRKNNPIMVRASLDCLFMWIPFFVLNTPRHIWVFGFSVPEKPKQTELAARLP
jgi:hypothetical protein